MEVAWLAQGLTFGIARLSHANRAHQHSYLARPKNCVCALITIQTFFSIIHASPARMISIGILSIESASRATVRVKLGIYWRTHAYVAVKVLTYWQTDPASPAPFPIIGVRPISSASHATLTITMTQQLASASAANKDSSSIRLN